MGANVVCGCRTLVLLGLWDIRYSLIGDERVRGISGGQRKRVCDFGRISVSRRGM
jgi:hypothetical protein